MKVATTVGVDDIWSTRESHAMGYIFGSDPHRNTEIAVELMTVVDPDWQNVVWLRVQRDSTHAAESWGKDHNTQIVLLADEVDALISALQSVVREARKSGVLAPAEAT
ncbi:MAG: hypothetical protein ACR2M1_13370 [Gemmatimonadaceae bacterium]